VAGGEHLVACGSVVRALSQVFTKSCLF